MNTDYTERDIEKMLEELKLSVDEIGNIMAQYKSRSIVIHYNFIKDRAKQDNRDIHMFTGMFLDSLKYPNNYKSSLDFQKRRLRKQEKRQEFTQNNTIQQNELHKIFEDGQKRKERIVSIEKEYGKLNDTNKLRLIDIVEEYMIYTWGSTVFEYKFDGKGEPIQPTQFENDYQYGNELYVPESYYESDNGKDTVDMIKRLIELRKNNFKEENSNYLRQVYKNAFFLALCDYLDNLNTTINKVLEIKD